MANEYNYTAFNTSARVAATGALFNGVFETLSNAIGNRAGLTTSEKTSLVLALNELKNSVDIIGTSASGVAATTVDEPGGLSSGATEIIVDDVTGFVEDAYIVYPDGGGGTPEYNEIASVNVGASKLLLKNATTVDIDDGALLAMITIDQVLAAGNYSNFPSRLDGIDALPGPVVRTVNSLIATTFQITFRQGEEVPVGAYLVISPFTTNAEIRQITAMSGRTATIAALANSHAANSAIIWMTEPRFPVTLFGGVYGSGVSSGQKTTNLVALHAARDELDGINVGTLVIGGDLYVDDTVDFSDLGQTNIGIKGEGGLNSGASIVYDGTTGKAKLFDLQGTSYFRMDDLTLDGNDKANVGLYCERETATYSPAGKHHFQNVRVVNCLHASHVNYASEENTYIKCQFQRSPVGAVFTGYPLETGYQTAGVDPADWAATWRDATSHYLYDCAFGDSTKTSRCGLMICRAAVNLFGALVQTKSGNDAEAYIIMDGTQYAVQHSGVHCDSGLANITYKVGQYAPSDTSHQNRVALTGSHLTMNSSTGTNYIKAKNLQSSQIGPLTLTGRTPAASYGFDLEDSNCKGNVFIGCTYTDGTQVTITDGSADPSNVVISRGRISFLAGSASSIDPTIYFDSSLVNRLRMQAGLYLVPDTTSVNGITMNVNGEGSSRFVMTGAGVMVFGSGSGAGDSQFSRQAANQLGTDNATRLKGGDGTYNGGHLQMGNSHLWLGANGEIRRKTSTPGSQTDGFFVGNIWDTGATGARPGSPVSGQAFFDTTLGIPIWYDGANWVDATGATV